MDEHGNKAGGAVLNPCWTILVVDDETDAHAVTRMVFKKFSFEGRRLEILSAYSAADARQILAQRSDIALILIDVCMGGELSGLEVITYVREQLHNHAVRIVLRTAQQNKAPETEIITKYDINDYKSKEELTSQKFFTLLYSNLRSYRDILAVEEKRSLFELVINELNGLSKQHTDQGFVSSLISGAQKLQQASAVEEHEHAGFIATAHDHSSHNITVIDAGGSYQSLLGSSINGIDEPARSWILEAFRKRHNIYAQDSYVIYCANAQGDERVIYQFTDCAQSQLVQYVLDLFIHNASSCFTNLAQLFTSSEIAK